MSSPSRSHRKDSARSDRPKDSKSGTSQVIYQTKHGSVIGVRSGIQTPAQANTVIAAFLGEARGASHRD